MKVYIVSEIGIHGSGEVIAVYDTKDKANNHKIQYPHPLISIHIQEFEVE